MPPAVPFVPIGQNAPAGVMRAACPSRNYARCFGKPLGDKYTLYEAYRPTAAESAAARRAADDDPRMRGRLPNTSAVGGLISSLRARGAGPQHCAAPLAPPARAPSPFAGTSLARAALLVAANATRQASAPKRMHALYDALGGGGGGGVAALRCDGNAGALNGRLLLLLGVPSTLSAKGLQRRSAARAHWMRHEGVGTAVLGCVGNMSLF